MKTALLRLRDKLGSDASYFQKVYNYTFEFSRPPGQRSLGMDMAKPFWGLLLPHGLQGGALSHIPSTRDVDGDDQMGGVDDGWQDEYIQWWFSFLDEKKLKGVSKDVWQMVSLCTALHVGRCAEVNSCSSWSSFALSTRDLRGTMPKVRVIFALSVPIIHNDLHAAAWPSTIDDFVEYAKNRRVSGQ